MKIATPVKTSANERTSAELWVGNLARSDVPDKYASTRHTEIVLYLPHRLVCPSLSHVSVGRERGERGR